MRAEFGHFFFPVQNKDTKALVEGTPGFTPSMYQHIEGTVVDRVGLAKQVRANDQRLIGEKRR